MDHLGLIAHALRSPLTGLSALVEMLEAGTDGDLTPAQAGRVVRIRGTIDRLVSITDQITVLARAEAGRLDLMRSGVDLGEVILLATEEVERLRGGEPVDVRVRKYSRK